jgi:hypothetical protein
MCKMIEKEIEYKSWVHILSDEQSAKIDKIVLDSLIEDGIIPSRFGFKLVAVYEENADE